MTERHEGTEVRQPFVVSNLLNGQTIATLQAAFPLNEADFLRLKGGPPATSAAAALLFSGGVGYAISLGPKIEATLFGGSDQLSSGEVRTMIAVAVISLVLYGAGWLLPNEKRRILRRIEAHFRESTPSTHIVGGKS
jgi:hypothetical protein